MDALTYLKDYSDKSDRYLNSFFREKKKQGGKIDKVVVESLGVFETYCLGGKKLRGALTVLGFQIAGGRNFSKILPVSCGVELLHNFLLIHDDIIDNDGKRRGKPTLHKLFSQKKDGHFGLSKAIVVGDIGAFLGYELLINSKFPKERITRALSHFNGYLLKTMYGEILDIEFDLKKEITWEAIMKVRIHKTALYTFLMPLVTGAALAGLNDNKLVKFEGYGVPVGIAFQLTDDILGVFGSSKKTGKSSESDIREGKKTFLYTKALELASVKDRKFILKWYGSRNLDKGKIASIREIFSSSGSLEYSQELARKMAEKGKRFIPRISNNHKLQGILASLADFVVERKS